MPQLFLPEDELRRQGRMGSVCGEAEDESGRGRGAVRRGVAGCGGGGERGREAGRGRRLSRLLSGGLLAMREDGVQREGRHPEALSAVAVDEIGEGRCEL